MYTFGDIMTGYTAFLIAPFATGLDTDLSPWLLPQDAFTDIVNGHIRHGAVEKREGFVKLGDTVYQDQSNWVITGVTLADPCVITLADVTGLTNGDVVEIRNIVGTTQLNGHRYTVANVTGGAGGTFELENVDSSSFTAWSSLGDVYIIPGTRVMGLYNYIDSGNVKELIAFDQLRACKYNGTNENFDPIDSTDIMDASSDNNDYIHSANWSSTASTAASTQYRLYFTNGRAYAAGPPALNGIRYYDGGTATAAFRPEINSGSGNYLNGCKLIFAFKQRLVCLHTIEASNTYPQRARWCQAQGPSVSGAWDDDTAGKGGFVDAPTGDHIISAQFLQDSLIVYFTNSIWTLRPTSDPGLPFRWDKLNDFRACDGKMTTAQFDRYVLAAGRRGITATDGIDAKRVDHRIQDFVNEEINSEYFAKVFAKRSYSNERLWMLYPKLDSEEIDAALIYDDDSQAFSKYNIAMNVLGYGGAASDSTIADFGDKTLNSFSDDTIRDFYLDASSEIFLGGNVSGEIHVLEEGGDDDEKILSFDIYGVTKASPAVVTIGGDIGFVDGDIITISDVGGMTEINNREFTIANKSGNEFELSGVDSSTYTTYTSGGTAALTSSNSISFELNSAAWNPWMQQGKQAQLGYIDLFVDTHEKTDITVSFYANNSQSPYVDKTINLLPYLTERSEVSNITQASPACVTSNNHGLLDDDEVYIYGVDGMEAINGASFTVTVVDVNNFTIGVDSTDYGIYKSGGVITELPYASSKAWKRVYAGGTGYQHKIKITSKGKNKPLKIHAFMPWFKERGRVV